MDQKQKKFEQLYGDNRAHLYAYIIRSLRDENAALDILQDVFLNFFRIFSDKEFSDDIHARMYLFKIARNLIINYVNTAYHKKVDISENLDLTKAREVADGIVEQMNLEESEVKLQILLNKLTEEERTALILRYQQDMKLEEIAKILDMSVSSVSRLIKKTTLKVRELGLRQGFSFE